MRIALRALLLVCALLLVPPPGWCCYFVDEPQATPSVPSSAPTKKSCCHQEIPQPLQPSEQAPGKVLDCCCLALDSLKPNTSVQVVPDVVGLPLLTLPFLTVCGTGVSLPARRDTSPPTLSLHLLHCVWLC